MLSGLIKSEEREIHSERGNVTLALWEEGSAAGVDLPWCKAADLAAQDISSLLAHARTVVIAVGKTSRSTALLDMALTALGPGKRAYVYAGRELENNRQVRQALSQRAGTVLTRLGFELPTDWLVVDGHRGWLLVGPPGGDRRWALPVEGAVARALFQAFRFLFWHHATREALPDASGTVAYRAPLAAPFPDPGSQADLVSGRIIIGALAPEPMADAEIRIAPDGIVPGPAATLFLPPKPTDFAIPKRLARELTRVIWTDVGLPRTAISRERAVLSFHEPPVSLQLEWPRAEAIDLYHRLSRAAQSPALCFHPTRRLVDVKGPVLIEGAARAAALQDSVTLQAPEVVATLDTFETAKPLRYPEPPPLAMRVNYRFKVSPVSVPPGAREAEIVRRWRAVDEWARRRVDALREVLSRVEGEEKGFFERLRTWLSGHETLRQRRAHLRQELEELGEAPPSQQAERAADLVRRMEAVFQEVRQLVDSSHAARNKAEDASAEAEQRAAWEAGVSRASEEAKAKRSTLVEREEQESTAAAALDRATKKLDDAVTLLRDKRRAALASERREAADSLEAASDELKEATDKTQRKQIEQRIAATRSRISKLTWDIESVSDRSAEAAAETDAVSHAQTARDAARRASKRASEELQSAEGRCREPFVFRPPPRPGQPDFPPGSPPPVLPAEAPPELGELFEDGGKRYLAVKTWEQARNAADVARRLHAELVASLREAG